MNKRKKASIVIVAVTLILTFSLTAFGFSQKPVQTKKKEHQYILRSYRNSVALYIDGELDQIYDNIVLNSLPEIDRVILADGIEADSMEEIMTYLEDFDG